MHITWKPTRLHGAPSGGAVFTPNAPAGHMGNILSFDAKDYLDGTRIQAKGHDDIVVTVTAVTDTTGEKVWQPGDYDPHTQGPPGVTCAYAPKDWAVVELTIPDPAE